MFTLGMLAFLSLDTAAYYLKAQQFPFRLCGWCGYLGWLRLASDSCPPTLLSFFHALSGGSGEFLALAGGRFRRGGWFGGATGQHGTEFGDLSVDLGLLRLEAVDGGGNYLGCELFWHCAMFFLDSLCPACTAGPILHLTQSLIQAPINLSYESAVTVGGIDFAVELSSRDERSGK